MSACPAGPSGQPVVPALESRARPCRAADGGWFRREILAGVDEPVAFELVLLVVQLPVAAAPGEQLLVRSSLDDLPGFEHENLIRALDRRQPMRNDERGASAAVPASRPG